MIRGSLELAMEGEHKAEKDSTVEFTTPNGMTTSSAIEWEVVVCPVAGKAYPERAGYAQAHPEWCRRARPLNQMLADMEVQCNEKLRKAGHSELIREELIGGRLYTGPCYAKYNAVLRSKSKDPYLVGLAKETTLGNDYVTTIHAINSCVLKLSKLTKAGKVLRVSTASDARVPSLRAARTTGYIDSLTACGCTHSSITRLEHVMRHH